MRFAFLFLVAGACSQAPNVDLHVTLTPPDTTTADADDAGDTDVATDTDISIPEYNGQRAVLEGWMSSMGMVTASPGETVTVGQWSFDLTSFDGLKRAADIVPTEFHFMVDSQEDGQFGTPFDMNVTAGDIINRCWLTTAPDIDIGGPELNGMRGTYVPLHVVERTPFDQRRFAMQCSVRSDAPQHVAFAVQLYNYNVISDSDVYDASTARQDNAFVGPQYWVQVGSRDTCEPFDLALRYGGWPSFNTLSASLPTFELDTTGMFYDGSGRSLVDHGIFHTADGCGTGYQVIGVGMKISGLPDDTAFTNTSAFISFDGASSQYVTCTSGSHGDGTHKEIWCEATGLSGSQYEVTPAKQGVDYMYNFVHLPEMPANHEVTITTYYKWRDLSTGIGTDLVTGWFVMDGDSITAAPY